MFESRRRSILKALCWRVIAALITMLVAWCITGEIRAAALIGGVDTFVKIGAYYAHERVWNHIRFGRLKPPEYEI